ncbi:hypothetical protein RAA17_08515 [Komagataeibacter rhaeticus]|nr:hypothetical protein [Komagataeibacter rhaeticus]
MVRDLLLVRGGMVVTGQASLRVDVLCGGMGEMLAVGPDLDIPAGCTVVDAGGLLVMPGGVDPHTAIGADEAGFARTVEALAGAPPPYSIPCTRREPHWTMHGAHGGMRRRVHGSMWGAHGAARSQPRCAAGHGHAGGAQGVNAFHLSMADGLSDRAILQLAGHAAACGALCRIEAQNAQAVAYLRAELARAGITGARPACSVPPAGRGRGHGPCPHAGGAEGRAGAGRPGFHHGGRSLPGRRPPERPARGGACAGPHLVVDETAHDPDAAGGGAAWTSLPPFRDGTHRRALWGHWRVAPSAWWPAGSARWAGRAMACPVAWRNACAWSGGMACRQGCWGRRNSWP